MIQTAASIVCRTINKAIIFASNVQRSGIGIHATAIAAACVGGTASEYTVCKRHTAALGITSLIHCAT